MAARLPAMFPILCVSIKCCVFFLVIFKQKSEFIVVPLNTYNQHVGAHDKEVNNGNKYIISQIYLMILILDVAWVFIIFPSTRDLTLQITHVHTRRWPIIIKKKETKK